MQRSKRLASLTGSLAVAAALLAPAPASAQTEPFISQMAFFGSNFCPTGWARTDGQLLPIAQSPALFSLLGTMYGGDGETTFALPDLRGRSPIHAGNGPGLDNYQVGQRGGVETVTLTVPQMPSHNHLHAVNNTGGDKRRPGNDFLSYSTLTEGLPPAEVEKMYASTATLNTYLDSNSLTNSGGSRSHENRPPYLAATWCIALYGVYPSPS